MAKKILFCATVDYHFKAFHLPYMKWFKEQGWEVHVAAAGEIKLPYTDKKFNIPIQRSPFNKKNIEAYTQLKKLLDTNNYSIVHCHTPLGGVLTRLAAKKARQNGTKMFYTAHGFHFCKGAPIMNWLLYYPIERYLSTYTDTLITINEEDYELAVKHKFNAQNIAHVHGVGVDTERFKTVSAKRKKELRFKLGLKQDDLILFYAAEFNKNKNQQLLIKALAEVKDELPTARLLLAGEGAMLHECKKLAMSLGVYNRLDFLGFRKDIDELLPASDIAVASSYREGLPVNIMEAMACGLPVIATENRGHNELIQNGINGFLIQSDDVNDFASKLIQIGESVVKREGMGIEGRLFVNKFSIKSVKKQLLPIYSSYMTEETDERKNKYHRSYL